MDTLELVSLIIGTGLRMLPLPDPLILNPELSAKRSRQQDKQRGASLRVLDLDVNANVHLGVDGNIQRIPSATNGLLELSDKIAELSVTLPIQAQGVIRLYVERNLDTDETYLTHLQSVLRDSEPKGYRSDASRGFEAAASQWSGLPPTLWCTTWSFGLDRFANSERIGRGRKFKLVARFVFKNTVAYEAMIRMRAMARALSEDITRKARKMRLLDNEQGGLVMLMSCQNHGPVTTDDAGDPDGLINILTGLWSQYLTLTCGSGQILRKKLLILWYHHTHLVELSKFITAIHIHYFQERQSRFDSRNSSLELTSMEDMAYDIGLYRELESSIRNLTTLIESLSTTIEATFNLPEKNDVLTQFQVLMADIRGICADTLSKTTDMSSHMEHHLKFLGLRREIKQSNSLWILSVLASIFLPLSLASGVLSMGTRFNELGPLLYDFCGVTVLLMTLAFVILVATRLLMALIEVIATMRRVSNSVTHLIWTVFLICMILLWLAIILSSFLVGMLKDIQLGGRILGFGMLCLLGLVIVGFVTIRSISITISSDSLGRIFGLIGRNLW